MSKVEPVTFTCPECGWIIKTPFGAEDAAEHTKLHIEKHHNESCKSKNIKNTVDKTPKIKWKANNVICFKLFLQSNQ